jgi:phosphatidylglycerophosphate synthase
MNKGSVMVFWLYKPTIAGMVWVLSRTPVRPNQVTVAKGILAFATMAPMLRIHEHYGYAILAAFMMYLSQCMDYADGCLGRVTGRTSTLGIWLDRMAENTAFIFYFFGCAMAWSVVAYDSTPWITLSVLIALRWYQQYGLTQMMQLLMPAGSGHTEAFGFAQGFLQRFGLSVGKLALTNETQTSGIIFFVLLVRPDWALMAFAFYHGGILAVVTARAFWTNRNSCSTEADAP